MTDLTGKVALVTGASRGIGAAVARAYGAAGAHVILLARTVGGLEETDDAIRAAGGKATIMPADLTDFDKLDSLGPTLMQHFGGLDIFVGNAGQLGTLGPVAHMGAGEFDMVIDVNLKANFRLIRTLDPVLRAAPAGRMLFVTTSQGVTSGRAYWSAYAASKAALESLVKSYAAETGQTNLRVNLVDPGSVRTAMRAKAKPGEDPATLPDPDSITGVFIDLAAEECARHGDVIKID